MTERGREDRGCPRACLTGRLRCLDSGCGETVVRHSAMPGTIHIHVWPGDAGTDPIPRKQGEDHLFRYEISAPRLGAPAEHGRRAGIPLLSKEGNPGLPPARLQRWSFFLLTTGVPLERAMAIPVSAPTPSVCAPGRRAGAAGRCGSRTPGPAGPWPAARRPL